MELEKLSQAQVQDLLKKAGASIRALHDENNQLKEKMAGMIREEKITKVAKEMHDKGLNPDLTFEEKLAALRESESLDVAEQAIGMVSPQGIKLAEVHEDFYGSNFKASDRSKAALETFIATGEIYE